MQISRPGMRGRDAWRHGPFLGYTRNRFGGVELIRVLSDPILYLPLAVCCAASLAWGQQPSPAGSDPSFLQLLQGGAAASDVTSPWLELAKLVTSAVIGLVVTSVHRHYQRERAPTRALLQAEVLLCVSGALMMIIIGNSAARALGIAGGASIIRFRTPVDDPKDAILLFLLMGLGMSAGLGSFAVCGLGTVFLCLFLVLLDRFGEQKPRIVTLDVISASKEFPMEHVGHVLRVETDSFEVVKLTQGNEATAKFSVKIPAEKSLTYMSGLLMGDGTKGIKSVGWDQKKADQ